MCEERMVRQKNAKREEETFYPKSGCVGSRENGGHNSPLIRATPVGGPINVGALCLDVGVKRRRIGRSCLRPDERFSLYLVTRDGTRLLLRHAPLAAGRAEGTSSRRGDLPNSFAVAFIQMRRRG